MNCIGCKKEEKYWAVYFVYKDKGLIVEQGFAVCPKCAIKSALWAYWNGFKSKLMGK